MPNQNKHILVIRLSAMGDVAMTVPVLRALVAQHPNLKITVLTRPFYEAFFSDIPNTSVHVADVKGKYNGVLGLRKLSNELKELNIDAIADLHNVLRTKILKLFLRTIPFVQINKGRKEKKALTSGKIFHQLPTTHQRYAKVFQELGYAIDLSTPVFPPKCQLSNKSQSFIKPAEVNIGIAPFAAFEGKTYPIERMEKVIKGLNKDYNVILFGGGKQEASQLQQIADDYRNVTSIAGKLELNEELDIISNLNLMISMDSGNAHIAAMLGVKVITIWGVTHPFAGFMPFAQDPENALLADREKFPKIPTSVYGKNYPNGYEKAIETITPEEILSKVRVLLTSVS